MLKSTGQNVTGNDPNFVVRAVDAHGHAVRATARVRVIAYGQALDTIGWFGFDGALRRTYRWSPTLGGASALLEAKVVGPRATRVVRYSIHVVADTGRPRFRATLVGSGHAVTAGAPWHFLVRALDARGNSIQGTAIVRVVAGGQIVDTIGWFGFKRRLLHAYRWSPRLRGTVALLQAKVVGPGGTRTVVYAVRVR